MNEYKFDELEIGMKACFQTTITKQMQEQFTQLSGDINPLHIEEKYASQHGYDDVVVYGMLTSAFYSRLVGVYLPGKNCLFQECKISFNLPVYIGDHLTVKGEIKQIHTELRRITVKARIINQNNKTVSKATLEIGLIN